MSFLPQTKYLKSLKTPLCLYQTRRGTLLHLTHENQTLFELEAVLLSLGDFIHMDSLFSLFPEQKFTIHKFLNFPNKLCVLSPIDNLKKCIEGINKKTAVKLKTIKGYEEFSIVDFIKLASLMKPDVLISLTEEPVSEGSGVKSHSRCVEKSIEFLDLTISGLQKAGTLENLTLVGCVQGGKYEDLRRKSINETLKRKEVKGLMIYGLCEGESFEERGELLKILMNEIPKEKMEKILLMLHSKGEPVDVLHGLSWGIDCFEVDYPFCLAENGSAFCFEKFNFMEDSLENKDKNFRHELFEKKRARIIDLVEEKFEMDKGPIWKGCGCYSCKNHSRAYVHHLIKSKEMTANVLLTIHNLHNFEVFFKNVKNSLALKCFPEYVNWFLETQTM